MTDDRRLATDERSKNIEPKYTDMDWAGGTFEERQAFARRSPVAGRPSSVILCGLL